MIRSIIIVSGIVLVVILGALMVLVDQKEKKHRVTKNIDGKNNSKWRQLIYIQISKNPLTKTYVMNIRKRYQLIADIKEHNLRAKTVDTFVLICVISMLTITMFAVISKSLITILFSVVVVYFIAESIVDIFVTKLSNKVMKEQIELHEKLRHYYYEFNDINNALYQSGDDLAELYPEIAMQGMKIYDILNSKTVDEDIIDYNDTAPNRFLKLLLGLLYTSMEYGDTKDDKGRSQLLNNISILNQEIRLEVFKREKINYFLRSLNVIVLSPLLAMAPIKNWASNNFFPLQKFYDSSLGTIVEITMYIIIVLSYFSIRKMQQMDSTYTTKKRRLTDFSFISKAIGNVVPMSYTKKRARLERLIKESGENISVGEVYARKVVIAVLTFLLSTLLAFSLHQTTVSKILNSPDVEAVQSNFLGGQLGAKDIEKAKEITRFDRHILEKTGRSSSYDIISSALLEDSILTDQQVKDVVIRIQKKAEIINGEYYKWQELMICMLLGFMAFYVPNLLMIMQRRLVRVEMENEVSTFQSTVLMLTHIDRMNVDEVIEWLCKYAVIFKEPLEECLTEFDSGAYKALEKMKHTVEYKGMKDLISGLQTAVNSLSLKSAFDELESDKEHFFKIREETNNRMIESKKGGGRVIGFLPLYALIGLYFGFPMLYSSMNEMVEFFTTIKNF